MICAIGLTLIAAAQSFAAEKLANQDCLDCHTDPSNSRKINGQSVPMAVFPTNKFAKSVHAKLDCVDCHNGIKDLVHDSKLPPPVCNGCHESRPGHEKAIKDYSGSIHGVSHALGASAAASCWSCHGSHDISPVKDPDSPVFKLNLPKTCATCHSSAGITKEYRIKYPEVASQYLDSIHGRALVKMGLIVAPSCNDCHGVHDIKRGVDRDSPINHANIARTCGKCHVKVEETYNKSVHGQLLVSGDKRGPVCTDCHTAHGVETPRNGHFKVASDERCGSCHKDRLEHYRDTYHGKAMALGKPNTASEVAACFDCHGHHDVLKTSNPESRLSKQNILSTCRQCHPDATAGFTEYKPHANPLDPKNYRALHYTFVFMTSLLAGVFLFFGGHTIAWLVRAGYLYWRDSKKFREAKIATQTGGEWFTRFAPFERFLHFLVVTSFLLLVITGMPLKFYYTNWAKTLFHYLGGPETARALHRFGALVTFAYFGLHVTSLVVRTWRNRAYLFGVAQASSPAGSTGVPPAVVLGPCGGTPPGPAAENPCATPNKHHRARMKNPRSWRFVAVRILKAVFGPDSMVPRMQDWRDFVAHNKWFFGKGEKPQFDRWTYWEKFDYFAVFWGVAIIGASGLLMWFPAYFTRILPGWLINLALIIHSDEALLAAGFIFSIHFFNTHFRIEKFPMDTVIFSGRISKNEMQHERRRWYDRLVAEGRLDQYRVRDEWERWKGIARSFGYFFFGLGILLLVLIIYAMLTRLMH